MTRRPRRHEEGTALILAVVMIVAVMGMVSALFISSQAVKKSTETQIEYMSALTASELAIEDAMADVIGAGLVSNGTELVGFVGQNLDAGSPDTCTVTKTYGGVTSTVQMQSAYLAYQAGSLAGSFLSDPSAARGNNGQPLFDYYIITASTTPPGSSGITRRVQAVVEVQKVNIIADAPAPLYIDGDPNPTFSGNAFRINGADHSMTPGAAGGTGGGGGMVECATCAGTGLIACDDCGGSGLKPNGRPCNHCGGAGSETCPDCNGTGTVADDGSGGNASWDDSAYLVPNSPNWRPAVGYNGPNDDASDYNLFNFNGSGDDQLTTVTEDGTQLQGQDAFVSTEVDLRAMAAMFVGGTADNIQPTNPDVNSYSQARNNDIGSIDDFQVSYVGPNASETVAGQVEGAGVLVYDGDLHISGQFTFYGLVIVLGEVRVTGGGAEIHTFGSVMVEGASVINGNADLWWSQEAMDRVMDELVNSSNSEARVARLSWREL